MGLHCYIILSLWTVIPSLLAGSSNGKTAPAKSLLAGLVIQSKKLVMVSCQEVCRLSTLVSDVWIEVTAGKDFVDFWDFLNKLSYTHALWPHNEIFLTQQKIAWRTQKASVKEDMPGVLSRRWYIFVPGRWQPTIFRVFQENLPQNTANQLFDHPASGIWYFFARALGTIDFTLPGVKGRQNPRIVFPAPFFLSLTLFLSSSFAYYWTSVWGCHNKSNMAFEKSLAGKIQNADQSGDQSKKEKKRTR